MVGDCNFFSNMGLHGGRMAGGGGWIGGLDYGVLRWGVWLSVGKWSRPRTSSAEELWCRTMKRDERQQ